MEPFGFERFIDMTWSTVINFLDKVNWNVSPDVLRHFPQLLQVYGGSLHFLLLHVRQHLLDDVHVTTLGRQVLNCRAAISLFICQVFLDYPSCVLRVVIKLESSTFVTSKRLSNEHRVVDEYLLVFGCCKVISDLVQIPIPLYVIESQTCRDPPPCFTVGKTQSDLYLSPLRLAHTASNCFQRVQTFSHL